MPGGQETQRVGIPTPGKSSDSGCRFDRSYHLNPQLHGSKSIVAGFLPLLPPRDAASVLVDTYFDRVHWFMLIFHQEDFRKRWTALYDTPLGSVSGTTATNPGFISTFLVVIAISLQYTGEYRRHTLKKYKVDPELLKDEIFSAVRSKLLDIVSLGSLEAVQTCVLLGTYYLYHGSPNLAWPVCGCGLRLAQALNLHRKLNTTEPTSVEIQRLAESCKRCWWAIYEIETFCSISYGYPHGIVDADCNVEPLNPLITSTGQSPASYNEMHQCPTSLLSYKYLMSKLSVFLKDVLHDLYGIGSSQLLDRNERAASCDFKGLLRKVPLLDEKLQKWRAEIPKTLCLDPNIATKYSSAEEMDRDIGASGPGFESHIYQLQALTLFLAYENARILVHRPLLTCRTKLGDKEGPRSQHDQFQKTSHISLQACRDAAMNTSYLSESPVFSLAADTYAASFISIHIFTAGVMLCVLTSIEPLTTYSQQSKTGLRRLLNMQAHLKSKSKSPLPAQGLDILERLTRLVMEKELKEILNSESDPVSQLTGAEIQPGRDLDTLGDGNVLQSNRAEPSGPNEDITDLMEDSTISQALFDLDTGMARTHVTGRIVLTYSTVLSSHDLSMPLDPILPNFNGHSNMLAQEQAWIWDPESFMPSFGQN